MKRPFIGNCIDINSFDIVSFIVEKERTITRQTFLKNTDLSSFPKDHPIFYKNTPIQYLKSKLPSGNLVYYMRWSKIEYFFSFDFSVKREKTIFNLQKLTIDMFEENEFLFEENKDLKRMIGGLVKVLKELNDQKDFLINKNIELEHRVRKNKSIVRKFEQIKKITNISL